MTEQRKRSIWEAIGRGLQLRCPKCGQGALFLRYLKVNDTCPHCGLELRHQRADDAPPYLVILIVGHLIIPLSVVWLMATTPPFWLYASVIGTLTTGLSLWLLPRMKGAVIGVQWANKMHGFGGHEDDL